MTKQNSIGRPAAAVRVLYLVDRRAALPRLEVLAARAAVRRKLPIQWPQGGPRKVKIRRAGGSAS